MKAENKNLSINYGTGVTVVPSAAVARFKDASKRDILVLMALLDAPDATAAELADAAACTEEQVNAALAFWQGAQIIGAQGEEKPAEPKSHWCTPPFYFYTREDAKRVQAGIDAGCGTDAPGSYIAWLCTQTPVHSMEMPGSRYDIGNLESYEQVQKTYRGIDR